MWDYKCDRCDKLFYQKSEFDRHKKRKNPCKKTNNILVNLLNLPQEFTQNNSSPQQNISNPQQFIKVVETYKCDYCCKELSRPDNLRRHILICKIKKHSEIQKEGIKKESLNKKSTKELDESCNKSNKHKSIDINKCKRYSDEINLVKETLDKFIKDSLILQSHLAELQKNLIKE